MCASSAAPPTPEMGDINSQLPVPVHSYKFKNTIKQRFSDDQEERRHKRRRDRSTSPSPPGSRSPSPSAKRSPSPPTLPATRADTAPVPIFVLHSKGSFYVPLTVAYDVLAPYLERIESGQATDTDPSSPRPASVLHPVTISVNFPQCPTQRVAPPPAQLAIPLPPHSPGNFGPPPVCCPVPSWAPYTGNGNGWIPSTRSSRRSLHSSTSCSCKHSLYSVFLFLWLKETRLRDISIVTHVTSYQSLVVAN